MNKATALFLALALALGLTACGGAPEAATEAPAPQTTAAPEETREELVSTNDGSAYWGFYQLEGGFLEIYADGLYDYLDYEGSITASGYCLFTDGVTLVDFDTDAAQFFVLDGEGNLYGGEDVGTYLRLGSEEPGDLPNGEPVDQPNGFVDPVYAERWYLFGDGSCESLTIQPEGLWELRNPEAAGGGLIICEGYATPMENGDLTLFEEDREVGFVSILEDRMILVLTMDYEWLLDHYQGELYFIRGACAGSRQLPMLTCYWDIPGLEILETNSDFLGGYLYQDITEDGLTVITNCAMENFKYDEEALQDYFLRITQEIGSYEAYDLTWEESPEYTQAMTYPVYLLAWKTGGSEDARAHTGFFFMTDTHSYIFSFSTKLDNLENVAATWNEAVANLILE